MGLKVAAGEGLAGRRAMSTAERRHQIIESAAVLFDARGYANTSMEDVALSVSVAKPTLYHYFRSKEEILQSIHEEFIQLLMDRYLSRASRGLQPEELVQGAMKDIFSLMVTHRGYVRVFFEHHRELPSEARRYVAAQRDCYESLVRSAIAAGQARGTFAADVDTKLTSLALFGMCNWAYQWFSVQGQQTADEIAETFWRLLLKGIQPALSLPALQVGAGIVDGTYHRVALSVLIGPGLQRCRAVQEVAVLEYKNLARAQRPVEYPLFRIIGVI
jgi:TetR/AcrR family transcriptional regulator, cholesterol catabolism regulator